jgi:hypothetical protein
MHDDLDLLLDKALNRYAAQEPQVGLESRVLRRATEHRGTRSWWMLACIPAVALAGFFLIVRTPDKPVPRQAVVKPAEVQKPDAAPARAVVLRRHRRQTKQPPVSPEELLARFVRTDPAGAIAALGEARHRDIELLAIEPLKIDELKITEDETK